MDEVEIKYRLDGPADHERLRTALAALDARPLPVQHEQNLLFDTAGRKLRREKAMLRLRVLDGGPRAKITFKGPARYDGPIKSRREIETDIADAATIRILLEALGYQVTLAYEKEREAWRLGETEIALDTLAFGYFCEIEGPVDEITDLARRLELDDARAESRGYAALMARHIKAVGSRQ
jgi:adenylate cyclase class 2